MAAGFSVTISATDRASGVFGKVNTGLENMARRAAATHAPFERFNTALGKLATNSGIASSARRVSEGFSSVQRRVSAASESLGRFAPALAGIASVASLAGLGELAQRFTDFGSRLGFAAQRANMTAGQLQGLQGAARLAGASADDLTSGVTALGDNLTNAIAGRAPQVAALMGQLGISFIDSATGGARLAEDVLPQIADKIASLHNPTQRAIVATTLLGGAGERLIPFLMRGRVGIAQYNEMAQRYGLLNERGVTAANDMRVSQTQLGLAIEGVGYAIAEKVAPVLTPLLSRLADWIALHGKDVSGFFERVAKSLANWVDGGGLDRLIKRLERVYNNMAGIVRFAQWLGASAREGYDRLVPPGDSHNGPDENGQVNPADHWNRFMGRPDDPNAPADNRSAWERVMPSWLGGRDAPGSAPGTLLPPGDPRLPRGIRNNNPTNLEYVPGQQGAIGSDGRFGRYGTMQAGVAAGLHQLLLYQDRDHLETVGAMIGRWAPSSENNTNAYAARVAASLGVDPNTPVNLHDPQVAARMISAMAMVENGRAVDPTQVRQGVDSILSPTARFGFPMHDDPSTWPVAPAAPVVPTAAPPGAAGSSDTNSSSTVKFTFENPPAGLRVSTVNSDGGMRIETPSFVRAP